ncbi:MAG: flagellar biosynthesis protein FlhB [Phycisphaeraceae bacterium]|nr:flagellar biosynthesis protein FlhB [Phycisphaerales bacterium]MCB9842948.1 flagellar biosynthesis protein FlhB [Phycisphaeraceae bacterium]
MAEDLGEKTEQPTERRRGEARQRGQLPKSTDLSSAIVMLGALAIVAAFAPAAVRKLYLIVRYALSEQSLGLVTDDAGLMRDARIIFSEAAIIIVPAMLVMVAVAYAGSVVQVGFLITGKPLQPDIGRLNIVKGFSRLFSKRSLVKGSLDVAKLSVLGLVAFLVIRPDMGKLAALASLSIEQGIMVGAMILLKVAVWALVILIILGVIDFTYQRWQTTQDLKMTRQEVKDERRSTDGDPETKGRRMRMAREIASQRLALDVPKADVIVTNPTHFSIAIKYDADRMRAPKVIAKGADYMAFRIRYIASANGVPIVERPPLARSLYAAIPVGGEIHAEHYEAVAEVLAYVYRMEGKLAS